MRRFSLAAFLVFAVFAARADVAVLTFANNLSHTGANLEETLLNTNNVNVNTFGLLYTRPVDDQIYTQPLIATNVDIPGKGTHNIVIVATVNDTIYAYDADDASVTAPYWTNSFINPPNVVAPTHNDLSAAGACGGNYVDFSGNMGIVGTPAIDPVARTIYLVARTKESGSSYVQRLHALDIRTGQERPNSPVVITATYSGTGAGSSGGIISFDPLRNNQRCALSLINGVVYIAWSSHCDLGPYHGWILGYDATNLTRVVTYNDTPNGSDGGIWMSDCGLAADTNGYIYLSTGNGTVGSSGNPRDLTNRGESFLKLARSGSTLSVVSWFTPYNYQNLENGDIDLGSGGFLLIPGTSLAFSGGKQGVAYLVDRNNMGGLSYSSADTNIIQSFSLTTDQIHGGMVWWDGPTASYGYMWPSSVSLQQYKFDRTTNKFLMPVFAQSPTAAPGGQPGAMLAISGNGNDGASGIVWAVHQLNGDANHSILPGILHAYSAQNVGLELWNSQQISSRDAVGNFAKFVPPTVANGKVYLATFSGRLDVYGVAAGWVAAPAISPNGGSFSGSTVVTISDSTAGASLFYTLDGSTPTTNSMPYTGSFTVTNTTVVKVKAVKAGYVDSPVSGATFLNSSALGNGTGLLGAYYSNQAKTFNNPATLTRTDSVVNFNWGTGSPAASVSADTFTVRWTGSVQPLVSDTYTFYTTADDGVRLWVNNQLIVDDWQDQSATERSGNITLVGQQRYNIRMEYYENGGSAVASLAWSSPSFSKAIVPQTQLYPVSNPPPVVTMTLPTNGSTFVASASVTMAALAGSPFNGFSKIDFYTNNVFFGTLSNSVGALTNTLSVTATGLGAGSYSLKAVASDLSGLMSTSAPVNITVTAGSGLAYGLTNQVPMAPFLNMPQSFAGALPPLLSQTGVFTNTPGMGVAAGIIPYSVNVPLWSDSAIKTRYLSVPNTGAPYTPDEQVGFSPTGEWTFPAGSIFVKTFELATNDTDSSQRRRLETRLIVRDTNGAAYGVTYKWRADNSEADLLTNSLTENVIIATATGTRTQTWYYPSPSDCLVCHTPAANYVLGVKTRQLNGNFTYPATGQTDNQLRTLNRLGLLNPAISESDIPNFAHLSALTNLSASLEERFRSYIDANCAQCHRPGGAGVTVDARYDVPLAGQNILNAPVSRGTFGYDNARVVVPKDVYRSILWDRMNTTNATFKMPGLARNLIDTNAVQVVGDWINSLSGTPALSPPTITPQGGTYFSSVNVALSHPDPNALLYFTLDGSLPTSGSSLYTAPITLTSNATLSASAFENGFNNSVASSAIYFVRPPVVFTGGYFTNQQFTLPISGIAGKTYVLQATTNFTDWISLSTNLPGSNLFMLTDTNATGIPFRFYRAVEMQ